MIDIRLKVFRSVAMNLSFTKAAQELFISQPAISKHVNELEREYGVSLFERMGSRISLTKAGLLMLDHANRILNDYQKMDFDMNALQKNSKGELRVGASTTISQYVMPEAIAYFRRQYPDIRITMLSGNSREIEAALEGGRIDIGMVEGIIRQPHLRYTPFMDDELVAIVSTRSRLTVGDVITIDELRSLPLVIREFGSGTLDVIRHALEQHGRTLSDFTIDMNFGTTEGIKHYVEHADCIGIVSVRSVSKDVYADVFRIIDIEGLTINRQFAFVEKRGESSKLLKQFKAFITNGYGA